MTIVGKKNGEKVMMDVPGDGFDAFLAFLKSGAHYPIPSDGLGSHASSNPSDTNRPSSLGVVPIASTGAFSTEMRKKQNTKLGGAGGGGGRRLDTPSSPTRNKTKGDHGPAPPSPSPTAKTAKTTGTYELDRKRNGQQDVPESLLVKDEKGTTKSHGGGLLSRLVRRLRFNSHSSRKDATTAAEDEVYRRNDIVEVSSILSSISSNESRESASSTIFPYHPFVAENGHRCWSSPGMMSSSCSIREQCSVQYSATYDRSELEGNASTWAFSIVGGGEIDSIEGGTVFDGFIDVNDLLRNARNFDKQPAWIVDNERRKVERMCGAFEV
ncbi:hypothetical protein ACHAXA_011024 [Cyclostephanos tholiformis]|uniref:Uncharacterized protein n=1 Tax=Cyclostephanos tholiformis TaxID=382380 RepID=A0ABD3RYU1_9STRA